MDRIIRKLIPYRTRNPNVDLSSLLADNVKTIGTMKESRATILYSV